MNIVISNYDSVDNPFYGGGGAIAINEIAKRLNRDHSVTILFGKYPHSNNKTLNNVTYKQIGFSFLGPKLGQIIFQCLLPFYANSLKYDIWIESFTPPISTAFLPVFTKKPVIGLAHSLDGRAKSKEYGIPFHRMEAYGLKKYKYFIVLTESVKGKIKKIHPSSVISIIPNGVQILKNKPTNTHGKHILFLGRIEVNHKGLDLLLKSYKTIASSTNTPLVIAGTGNPQDINTLKEHILSLNLGSKIKLVGKVTGKDKHSLLKQAAFMVLPSRYDNQPLTALEAMSYGKPLVTYNIEGLSWIPNACAIKVNPFNTNSYAKSMLKLLHDSDLRHEMSKKSKIFISKYDWNLRAKDYSSFIDKVLSY